MGMVLIQFRRRALIAGGAMYLPGEIAGVSPDIAAQFCTTDNNPAATLYSPRALDAPPVDKMARRPDVKKEKNG